MHPDTREETLWSGYRMSCLSPLTRRRWVGWSFGLEFTWFGGAVRGDLVDSEEKFSRAWRSSSLRWRCCDRNPWRVTSLLSAMCYSDLQYRVQIFVNAPHHVGMVLLVVVSDHTVNILLLYHSVVVDQSPQNLHIMEIPHGSILAVKDIVVDHGAEPLLVLVSGTVRGSQPMCC